MKRARGRAARLLAGALVLAATTLTLPSCGCEFLPRVNLIVDLQTDFAPFYDFQSVRVRIRDDESIYALRPGDEFVTASRVAEELVNSGSALISAELLDARGGVVAERALSVTIRGATSVRLVISALCRDVTCPSTQTCVQGICDDPQCAGPKDCELNDPVDCPGGLCDHPVCASAMDCEPLDDGCSRVECRASACVYPPTPGSCAYGNYCRPGEGCAPIPEGLDAGTPTDGSTGLPDGGLADGGPADGALPDFDAGDAEVCTVCTTQCGTTGLGVCVDGVPTGECLPPPENCTGRDDDCDGDVDEGLACGHTHPVVCDITGPTGMDMVGTMLVGNVVSASPPGTVCAAGICAGALQNCRTLPGPDSHVHEARINGGTTVMFGPGTTPLTPSGTSAAPDGHTHGVECGIFGPAEGHSSTGTYVLNLEELWRLDPLRYNRFCTGLDEEAECFDSWGNCVAR